LASPSGAPASYSRESSLGQLVTDSRPSVVNPYSSWVCSTDLEGLLPFFQGKKPWIISGQDSNVGWDAYGAHAPGYRPLAGPSLSTPHFKKAPGVIVEPIGGPTFELLGRDRVFSSVSLTCDRSWPIQRDETSDEFFEGMNRDCVHPSHGETWW